MDHDGRNWENKVQVKNLLITVFFNFMFTSLVTFIHLIVYSRGKVSACNVRASINNLIEVLSYLQFLLVMFLIMALRLHF